MSTVKIVEKSGYLSEIKLNVTGHRQLFNVKNAVVNPNSKIKIKSNTNIVIGLQLHQPRRNQRFEGITVEYNNGDKANSYTDLENNILYIKLQSDGEFTYNIKCPEIDIMNSWYSSGIVYGLAHSYIAEDNIDKINGNRNVTRYKALNLIYKLFGNISIDSSVVIPFKDVRTLSKYENCLKWGIQNNIINGRKHDRFAGNSIITKEEFVEILYRLSGETIDTEDEDFKDMIYITRNNRVSDWAKKSVYWARMNGYINCEYEGVRNKLTEAGLYTIIYRYLINKDKQEVFGDTTV